MKLKSLIEAIWYLGLYCLALGAVTVVLYLISLAIGEDLFLRIVLALVVINIGKNVYKRLKSDETPIDKRGVNPLPPPNAKRPPPPGATEKRSS